jgi:hypothetical protein
MMHRFEVFRILEGQSSWIGFAETFDDANAQGAVLEEDYLIVDNSTGQHVRTNKVVLREAFEYALRA